MSNNQLLPAPLSPPALESSAPAREGSALTDGGGAESAFVSNLDAVGATISLPPLAFDVPLTVESLLHSAASFAGFSAVSTYLGCPEKSRLKAAGVKPKAGPSAGFSIDLGALEIGQIVHALHAARVIHGHEAVCVGLESMIGRGMALEDATLLRLLLAFYEERYPLSAEPFEYIGVECEVRTNVQKHSYGRPVIRSVRYDTLVRYPDGQVFSMERKTMSRSGMGSIYPYFPQAMCQVGLWNANEALVAQYGRMSGIIWDTHVKTKVPKVERLVPTYFSRLQQQRALEYLRLPEEMNFKANEDGSYPRFLHSCWGRYAPCEYMNLCHDDAQGDYEIRGANAPAEEIDT